MKLRRYFIKKISIQLFRLNIHASTNQEASERKAKENEKERG